MGTAWRKLAMGVLVVCAVGCGPIEYVNEVTRKASTDVSSAKAVANDQDAHFRYWYTLAVEYLHKAREEASYADFQAANRFGRKAAFAARKARESAIRSAEDPASMVRTPNLDEGLGHSAKPDDAADAAVPSADDGDGDGFSDLGGDDENPLEPDSGDEP